MIEIEYVDKIHEIYKKTEESITNNYLNNKISYNKYEDSMRILRVDTCITLDLLYKEEDKQKRVDYYNMICNVLLNNL